VLIMNEDDKKAAKYRAEAKMGGTNAPAPAGVMQEIADRKAAAKAAKAPTTKTTMAKNFAKGGSVSSASKRADGCAQRGKTRGMIV